ERILDLIEAPFVDLGFETERIPGRGLSGGHLVARPRGLRPGAATQLLLGHCDTVWPVGTIEDMPFSCSDGRARGPGVFDMKGGIVQLLGALELLTRDGVEWSCAPVVLINSDEEKGSSESRPHIVRLARQAYRAFVLEPALGIDGHLKTRRKGVGRFDIRILGRSAHAGLDPGSGASAILALSRIVERLNELNDLSRGITVNVGRIDGGTTSNVVAESAQMTVDVRVPSRAAAAATEARIRSMRPSVPGTAIEISGGFGRPPLEKNERNQRLWKRVRSEAGRIGIDLDEGMAGGGSDGSTTSLFTATLDGLGPVGDGAHAAHEFLFVEKLAERTELLAHLLLMPPDE
ncbi:MAG: M20 family metallopeptidase, partial [Rhodothermales bacterium]|nr:M20 family metallopeptidase [Rhodothermales bacterium]